MHIYIIHPLYPAPPPFQSAPPPPPSPSFHLPPPLPTIPPIHLLISLFRFHLEAFHLTQVMVRHRLVEGRVVMPRVGQVFRQGVTTPRTVQQLHLGIVEQTHRETVKSLLEVADLVEQTTVLEEVKMAAGVDLLGLGVLAGRAYLCDDRQHVPVGVSLRPFHLLPVMYHSPVLRLVPVTMPIPERESGVVLVLAQSHPHRSPLGQLPAPQPILPHDHLHEVGPLDQGAPQHCSRVS